MTDASPLSFHHHPLFLMIITIRERARRGSSAGPLLAPEHHRRQRPSEASLLTLYHIRGRFAGAWCLWGDHLLQDSAFCKCKIQGFLILTRYTIKAFLLPTSSRSRFRGFRCLAGSRLHRASSSSTFLRFRDRLPPAAGHLRTALSHPDLTISASRSLAIGSLFR
ncbi:hypothetical protein CVT26_012496 [Gymnopilus dilepis]|uniref:Uncharacterized protein n=1 Tax=Gymnopilus dilepis TaxID=231916 RepID=A0A409YCY8_9AGAR|nr:hypothetical protein CVT26_012496 [Gymnopilus dilepis]